MKRVAIIAGCRTPFARAGTDLNAHSFLDLGEIVVREVIARSGLPKSAIEELVFGTVLLDSRIPNAAREIVLRSGLPATIEAHFVSNNCITGALALSSLMESIKSSRISCGIAAGAESMSRPSLSFSPKAQDFFLRLFRSRSIGEKLKLLTRFKASFLLPQAPSPKEPSTGLTMGEHCEITAKEFEISRLAQDQYALNSHVKAALALKKELLAEEIVPVGNVKQDNIIRGNTTLEKLQSLKPVFDKSTTGTLTAGNSSSLTDGASAILLMSEERAQQENRAVLGYIEDVQFSAISPDRGLLMAPATALPKLLNRNKLKVSDIDCFEIHEAFAAQVIANLKAWDSGWGLSESEPSIGTLPQEKINLNGGSLAIGHPFAATAGRLVLSAVNQLRRTGSNRAAISICAAGAMASAILVSRQ